MRIYTKAGDLAFKTFTFHDGQPHFKLETYELDFHEVTVEMTLANPTDLLMMVLVASTLRQHGYQQVNLDIRYLLGARMDRAISSQEPFTLQSIAGIINSCGFSKVRILDVHSEVATRLIRNSTNILPYATVQHAITATQAVRLVIPDKGAVPRVEALQRRVKGYYSTIRCSKVRDVATGNLTGFTVDNCPSHDIEEVIILDDICDGGGTFVGLAEELRKRSATKVYLFVTHGIFSKGLPLKGVDKVYTTDSRFVQTTATQDIVVIPISMKDM